MPSKHAISYELRIRLAAAESARRSRSLNADPWDPWEDKWDRQVDPERKLHSRERAIRGEHARKAHYARVALAKARARGADDAATRRLVGRVGSHERWSRGGRAEQGKKTAAAQLRRYERIVDPDGLLDPAERSKRVQAARGSEMRKLAATSRLRRRERQQRAAGAKPVSVEEATRRIAERRSSPPSR